MSNVKKGKKILTEGNMETKYGSETILWMKDLPESTSPKDPSLIQSPSPGTIAVASSACWQELDKTISWEALPEPDKYRGRCSQPTIELKTGSRMEELEKGLKELKGLQPYEKSNINQSDTPELPMTKPPSQVFTWLQLHMYRGWPFHKSVEGEALDPVKARCLSVEEFQGRREWVGRSGNIFLEAGGRGWDRRFPEGGETRKGVNIWNVNKIINKRKEKKKMLLVFYTDMLALVH